MIPAIARLPRITLGSYPTPLDDAHSLSAALGGPRILIKRDDLTGLALGGNKCRKLEFILGDALQKGMDVVIGTGGAQSNFALQLAAAARKLKMDVYLVLVKDHPEIQGNLLLHDILDSNVTLVDPQEITGTTSDPALVKMNALADDLRRQGKRPLVLPVGGHIPLGTTGWVNAVDETWQQLKSRKMSAQYFVITTGSFGTQAGLELGVKYLKLPTKVIGISVAQKSQPAAIAVADMANQTAKLLGMKVSFTPEEITVYDQYIGEGYGKMTEKCRQAIKLVAQTEGIFLDPVYTGKTMAGLIDLVRKGKFTSKDTVVFFHTGGIAALFAYVKEMTQPAS
jgi:D-cysteine desulfhydrase family pyridoxal phosphate-dependent enzyme